MTTHLPSIHELRRRAPAHHRARAENARFAAFLLLRGSTEPTMRAAAEHSGYGGTPSIAAREAFLREAALALELIVKAVIAQKIQDGRARQDVVRVRPTHDVPRLWGEAELPKVSNEDQQRLLFAKQLLTWSGRYAAPRDDDQLERERAELRVLEPPAAEPGFRFRKTLSFDWEDFDRLYQIAARGLAAASAIP